MNTSPMSGEVMQSSIAASSAIDADVYLFNAEIGGTRDFSLINCVAAMKSKPTALLVLTTHGGDPDCAYRMCRYLQNKYDKLIVLIAGRCKSAGTLVAIGATEIAFMPYGELGPLDIQMSKVDKFDRAESGLTIQDALLALEERARDTFATMVQDYIQSNNGMLSFQTATKAAGEFVAQLYAPVFGRIDPEEIGVKSRSMRIAQDYGARLNAKWENLKPDAISKLATSYPSHSFVIDMREAQGLFNNVRAASTEEANLVMALSGLARFQVPREQAVIVPLFAKVDDTTAVNSEIDTPPDDSAEHANADASGIETGKTDTDNANITAEGDHHANDDDDRGRGPENGENPRVSGQPSTSRSGQEDADPIAAE